MEYSRAFRIVRAAFGLSQAELASLLHIGPSQISLIESGKRQPSHKVIRDLAEIFRIPSTLITLLASDPDDLEVQGESASALALSLLKLLVSASGKTLQPTLPFPATEESEG